MSTHKNDIFTEQFYHSERRQINRTDLISVLKERTLSKFTEEERMKNKLLTIGNIITVIFWAFGPLMFIWFTATIFH